MTSRAMDNTGQVPLRVPGFNDIPLDYELPQNERFTHAINEYVQTPAITARELAMTAAMNDITDKDDWRTMSAEQIAEWKTEMMSKYPLLSEQTWAWCVAELKDKAIDSRDFIRVLETGSCVCKSDELPASIAQALLEAPAVDPFMYPLMYGRTHVLDSGRVSLQDLYANADQAVKSERHSDLDVSLEAYLHVTNFNNEGSHWLGNTWVSQKEAHELYWSSKFQALPCEVDVTDGTHITSYVNNLPVGPLYGILERIIAASIDMWDECLVQGRSEKRVWADQEQRGSLPLRIVTFGPEWLETLPPFARAFSEDHRRDVQGRRPRMPPQIWFHNIPPIPELNEDLWRQAEAYLAPVPENWRERVWQLLQEKAESRRYWRHPEPLITYDDWKAGHNVDRSVVKMISRPLWRKECDPDRIAASGPKHERLTTQLRTYGSLQIIVKISTLESSSPWQVDGHLNEHIVASAMYVFQGRGSVSFRQETMLTDETHRYQGARPVIDEGDAYEYDARYKEEDVEALGAIYGIDPSAMFHDTSFNYLPVQNAGTVPLHPGRMVTWPNTLERRIESAEKLRFVTLQLVDPNYRICSTRNVPPQQQSWLDEAKLTDRMKQQLKQSGKVFDQVKAEIFRKQMQLEQEWITGARHERMVPFQF